MMIRIAMVALVGLGLAACNEGGGDAAVEGDATVVETPATE